MGRHTFNSDPLRWEDLPLIWTTSSAGSLIKYVGSSKPTVGDAIPWAEVLDYESGKSKLSTKQAYILFSLLLMVGVTAASGSCLDFPWWQTITQDGELKLNPVLPHIDFCQGVLSQQQKCDYDDSTGIHMDMMETHKWLLWEQKEQAQGSSPRASNQSMCSLSPLAMLLHSESQLPLEEATLK